MKFKISSILLAIFLSACHSNTTSSVDSTQIDGIVGGVEVSDSDPISRSTVGLLFTGQDPETVETPSLCSATLIAPDLVVTAAHCVSFFETGKVVFGRKFQNVREDGLRKIVKVIIHPKYVLDQPESETTQEQTSWNDIAVVKFEGSLPSGYNPVALLKDKASLKVGMTMTIAGYGLTSADGAASGIYDKGLLRKAQLILGSSSEVGPDLFFPLPSSGAAICNGDSGGSVYLEQSGELQLAGVISRGRDSHCRDYSIATNVNTQLKFLEQAMIKLRK